MASTELPVPIPVVLCASTDPPFPEETLQALAALMPDYLAGRRWFRAKARTIQQVQVDDVVPMSAGTSLFVLRIVYLDGDEDNYLLPLAASNSVDDSVRNAPATEPLAILRSGDNSEALLYSAFANPAFRGSLLSAIAANRTYQGRRGAFSARLIAASAKDELDPNLQSSVSRAEQSNTSVIYGSRFILKLFRKIEEGINPDLEIGAYLTERGFAYTPAVIGVLEYQANGRSFAAGLLQHFVENRGDAWKFTLEALAEFFDRALSGDSELEPVPQAHPLDLILETVPERARKLVGSYLGAARLLGWRTAEMHAALAQGRDPAFQPEPFGEEDSAKLSAEMNRQADITFEVLRNKLDVLTGDARAEAQQVSSRESEVRQRFETVLRARVDASRIRFHGDYHLGQVLYTGDDFMIIDFEGEPARPLEERRRKALAMRDVAGMVRSFQYAAYAAMFGLVPGDRLQIAAPELTAHWSAFWYAWISRSYLQGYFETAGAANYLPPSDTERRMLLDAFLLQKALYEVAYELNNRPAWVRIPLRGILSLIA